MAGLSCAVGGGHGHDSNSCTSFCRRETFSKECHCPWALALGSSSGRQQCWSTAVLFGQGWRFLTRQNDGERRVATGTSESLSGGDKNRGEKREFLGSSAFFVISACKGPRRFGSGRQSAARVFCSMIKLRMDSRRRICLCFWKARNAHFSVVDVLELRSSRSGFDGQLCVCTLLVIIYGGGD